MTDHAEIAAVADRFFAAIEAGDVDALREIYAPDATVWHNFDDIDQPVAENLKTLTMLHSLMPDMRYTEVRRTIIDGGFVQQHVLLGTAPGGALKMAAMLRVDIADGHVQRIEEYLDPSQARVLRG